jgi:alpha-L-rhamnosidase
MTEDKRLLKEQWQSMQRWVNHGIDRDERGPWAKGKTWQLSDWLDPVAPPGEPGNGRPDPFLVADACLIYSLDLMAKISEVLELSEDRSRYQQSAAQARREFARKYVSG